MQLAFDWAKEGPSVAFAAFSFLVFLVAIAVSAASARMPQGALRRVLPFMFLGFVVTMLLAGIGAEHFHKG